MNLTNKILNKQIMEEVIKYYTFHIKLENLSTNVILLGRYIYILLLKILLYLFEYSKYIHYMYLYLYINMLHIYTYLETKK